MTLLIQGGTVIDPGRLNGPADVLIENGKVIAVGQHLDRPRNGTNSLTLLDATGLFIVPGFVDLHVHLREPGFEYKETIASDPPRLWREALHPFVACPTLIPSTTIRL